MKKIISAVFAMFLLLSLCACGTTSQPNNTTTATDAFTPPTDYVSILEVTINPHFRLYLDADNKVLATEPLNEDAAALGSSLSLTGQQVDTAVKEMITAAQTQGLVNNDAKIELKLTESKDSSADTEALLDNASSGVSQAASQLNIQLSVQAENTVVSEDPQPTVQENTIPETTVPETTAPAATAPHKHKYAPATCSTPKTCECGKKSGKALGHEYKQGFCTVCGERDPDFRYKPIAEKLYKWTATYVSGQYCYKTSLFLSDPPFIGGSSSFHFKEIPADAPEEEKAEYEKIGDGYGRFASGGSAEIKSVTEENDVITVIDLDGNTLVMFRIKENRLEVTSCTGDFGGMGNIPVGTIFAYIAD